MSKRPTAGALYIVSGPSGVGKSTLVQRLLKENGELKFSVSYTTRLRRPQETDDVHYHFVDEAEFKRRIEHGDLLEHARYNDHWYGTSAAPIRRWLDQGERVILEIDVQGAAQIRVQQSALEMAMCFVFILPPSFEHLKVRIRSRGTEDPARMEKRLRIAAEELKQADAFDVQIINDELGTAYKRLRRAVFEECDKIPRPVGG